MKCATLMQCRKLMRLAAAIISVYVAMFAAACTQQAGALSKDVGGPCEGATDCNEESFCKEGMAFPEGMCSLECEVQGDCIASTACSDRGLCLLRCFQDSDCRTGYSCIDEDHVDGGSDKVCANPGL